MQNWLLRNCFLEIYAYILVTAKNMAFNLKIFCNCSAFKSKSNVFLQYFEEFLAAREENLKLVLGYVKIIRAQFYCGILVILVI